MITDFRTLTGRGLRHISINGIDSLADMGVLICKDTQTDGIAAKSITEDMPYVDGVIDMSLLRGKIYYEPRTLSYKFKIAAATPTAYTAKLTQLKNWLNGAGKCAIVDSNYLISGVQWQFTNCICKGFDADDEKVFGETVYGYVTAVFVGDPYLSKVGEANERVLKCAASGNVTLTVTNNSSYTITTSGGTSESVSFTAAAPYKYRLVVYAENAETVLLNLEALDISQPFTMPSAAAIVIMSEGYKYVELWHDTRTGVML